MHLAAEDVDVWIWQCQALKPKGQHPPLSSQAAVDFQSRQTLVPDLMEDLVNLGWRLNKSDKTIRKLTIQLMLEA